MKIQLCKMGSVCSFPENESFILQRRPSLLFLLRMPFCIRSHQACAPAAIVNDESKLSFLNQEENVMF
jgi:hypothetical protein